MELTQWLCVYCDIYFYTDSEDEIEDPYCPICAEDGEVRRLGTVSKLL